MKAPALDQAMLHALLDYNPETGVFTWKPRPEARRSWNTRYAGKIAGFPWRPRGQKQTYLSIRIFDWPFLGHRLAWLYMLGEWPRPGVDHEDLDGMNNSWRNLRLATKAQNSANTGRPANNTSGFKGVSLRNGRYRATFRGRFLGYRDTPEEAAVLYAAAAREHFGEYARTV